MWEGQRQSQRTEPWYTVSRTVAVGGIAPGYLQLGNVPRYNQNPSTLLAPDLSQQLSPEDSIGTDAHGDELESSRGSIMSGSLFRGSKEVDNLPQKGYYQKRMACHSVC